MCSRMRSSVSSGSKTLPSAFPRAQTFSNPRQRLLTVPLFVCLAVFLRVIQNRTDAHGCGFHGSQTSVRLTASSVPVWRWSLRSQHRVLEDAARTQILFREG